MYKYLPFLLLIWACGESEKKDTKVGVINDSIAKERLTPAQWVASLNRQIEVSPRDYNLYNQRSEAYHAMDSLDAAIRDAEKSISLNDSIADSHYLLGFYAFAKMDTAKAMQAFRNAMFQQTRNAEVPYQMGQIFFLQKNYAEALRHYDIAIKYDSLNAVYDFAKGVLYEEQGKTTQAIQLYEKSIKKDSNFVKAYAQLHDVYAYKLKNKQKATFYNEKMLAINGEHPLANFNKGRKALEEAGSIKDKTLFHQKIAQAIVAYADAIKGDPSFIKALYDRGYCYFLLENYESATKDFEKIVGLDNKHYQAHFMLGSINEHFGDKTTALAHYEKALAAKPDFAEAKTAVIELKK